jgi:hypothetical protein
MKEPVFEVGLGIIKILNWLVMKISGANMNQLINYPKTLIAIFKLELKNWYLYQNNWYKYQLILVVLVSVALWC